MALTFFCLAGNQAYKMHIRVLLSKYRSPIVRPVAVRCIEKPEALLYRLHRTPYPSLTENGLSLTFNIHELTASHRSVKGAYRRTELPALMDEATDLLAEIRNPFPTILSMLDWAISRRR
ncbi:MAG: hypothetical protein U1F34_04825 [Gammaproteobacteria bacterium]